MKKWKIYQIVLFVIFCILLNFAGRVFASHYKLMLWLDSLGTVLCAYVGGPVCGAIVGVASNLIYGMMNHISYAYALTSIAIGVIAGRAAAQGHLSTMFGTMTAGTITAIASTVISVPLNIIIYRGSTGNIWGNGVASYLGSLGWPKIICQIIGEFYVDFLDKFVTLMLLHFLIKIIRAVRQKWFSNNNLPIEGMDSLLKILPILLIPGLILVARPAAAEENAADPIIDYNDYVQTVYNSSNGLPCGTANDIEQTNDGILWIGTYAGLYRYNGREFRWMDEYESVRNVNCLYCDVEGRLWIGTNDNGLSIAINEKIVNVIDQSLGLGSNSVRSIIQGTDGCYYIGTTGSMQVLQLNNGLKKVNTLTEVIYADKAAAGSNGYVAAVTNDGKLFLLKGGQIKSSIQLTNKELFNSCCFDPDGLLLAGTSGGHIYFYDISDDRFIEKDIVKCRLISSINDLFFLDNGDLFIAADHGIGYIDRTKEFRQVKVAEFNNSIDNALTDYQGNLWFTSSRLGLLRLAPSSFKDVYSTIGLPDRVVNTITKWRDKYYIGTDTGLDITDSTCHWQIQHELSNQLKDVRIRCLLSDSSGSLWICTHGNGLIVIGDDNMQHTFNMDNGLFGNRVRVATELSDGSVLTGGDKGLTFLKDHKIQETIYSADNNISSLILTITEMDDGRILVGTDGDGLAVMEDRKITRILTREDGLSSDVILRTVKDPKSDGLFLVTSNGLCYLDSDLSVRILQNFPYYNNYDIYAKDRETLFVLSSAGIYVVSRDDVVNDIPGMPYDLLDSRLGLNSSLTANAWDYFNDQGELFLACDKGVFIIDTYRYALSTRSYRMNLKSVNLDSVSHHYERGSVITLGTGISKLELFPEIINYSIQEPNAGYYLEGLDKDWTIMPQKSLSSIVYTNLPSGSYTLHLAVFDNNRENVVEERLFQIVKEKEIYDESWFKVYLLGVAMLFAAWIPWFFMQRALARAQQRIRMGNETIMAIANTVDAKDSSTSQHSLRVSIYAVQIGQRMGFSKKECENLRQAARMHDIGKIGIPDAVLNKPGRLTDEEYKIMKSHVTRGSEILQGFTLIDHVVEGARYHHERYDGKGYPEGLKGEDIPIYGRIIGVADAFDAMTANRVYRKQLDLDYVLGEMKRGRGTQFDPQCVDILLQLIDEGAINVKEMYAGMPTQDSGTETGGEKK